MSDVIISDADNGCVDVGQDKRVEVETPTSSNIDNDLAGSIEIDDEEKVPDARGAKRRISGDENGGEEVAKRLATDDDENKVDSTNDIGETSTVAFEKASKANNIAEVSASDNDTKAKDGSKKTVPQAVIEISDDSSDSDICAVDSYQASAEELKKIRGDNYSSSSEYSSDSSSSSGEDDSVVLGPRRQRPTPTARRPLLNLRAGRTDVPILNKKIISPDSTDKLSAHWAQSKDISDDNVELTCQPFKHCLLHNVLSNPEIINNIVDDMNTLDWNRKKMDLFEFHQTTDLANLTWQRSIRGIYDLLKNEIMPWISRVTGIKLTNTSASCSLYGPGDHLLVHDDLLGDRRVAFILYLAPWNLKASRENGDKGEIKGGWCESMGGALELFACDEDKQPTKAVRSIVPQNNTLAFFQVSPVSFHQVSEVHSFDIPRLSINGWFHGPSDDEPSEEPTRAPPVISKAHGEVALLSAWMTAQYLAPRIRLQIQQQMEKASEISLQRFLQPEKYQAVLNALAEPDVEWELAGPANQRHYDRLVLSALEPLERTHTLREFTKLFTSNSMYRLLHDCTDLTIQCHFHMELQRWRQHCYTVLPPKESYSQNQLDVLMYLGLPERVTRSGIVTYVAPEEESAPPLISLEPCNNALNLVYADAQTASFTKFVSSMSLRPEEYFYIVTCSYGEEAP